MSSYDNKKIVLIDGHSIINRAFYGMPDLTNSRGVHTGAVYGFLNIMFRILDEEKADYLMVAFDTHAPTFRHKMYDQYKGTRHPMPDELRTQVPLLQEVLKSMGIFIFSQEGIEADDILGTCARKAERENMQVSLVSGDRDLLQIADDKVLIRIPKTVKGQTSVENYHTQDVIDRYQITPEQVIEMKGLMGDSSDNIPGVPKVGEKTALQLLTQYGTVEGVYQHLDEITKKALHETLATNRDKAELSLKLATIKTDCDINADLDAMKIGNFYTKEAFSMFTELGFKNFLSRFNDEEAIAMPSSAAGAEEKTEPIIINDYFQAEDAFAVIKNMIACSNADDHLYVGVYPVCSSTGKLFCAVIAAGDKLYCLNISDPAERITGRKKDEPALDSDYISRKLGSLRKMKAVREDGTASIVLFDIKKLYPYLGIEKNEFDDTGIRLDGCFDELLACYLCNPLKNDYTEEDCAIEYLGATPQAFVQVFPKKKYDEVIAEAATDPDTSSKLIAYSGQMAEFLVQAAPVVEKRLKDEGMWKLYTDIELPLSYILYDMQRIGVKILPEALTQYGAELGEKADALEKKIFADTGEEFNISSPKQLGEILFEKMGIKGGKKTKTGWSTAADVLTKLAPDYPVVNEILEYRAVTKLKSTYADGLMAFVGEDQRIHTTYNQTITATGRISSTDPNLQNIPMRTEMGRLIRKAFIPREGSIFTDSDYSQIELRILASMSGDEELIEAYRQNKDIHAITASKVFHVPFDQVTPLQRRNAKAVNFGIVYGISSFGLSQDLSISRKEASEYIDSYFKTYPGVKAYLDGAVADAKKNGYSVTMYGRRRPIPELSNSNFMMRQFGERVAMNAPIQGTAADIMKIAMIRVFERIHREHLKSQLILQIHDELLIETDISEEKEVVAILEEEMKNAADLPVSLEVDVETGTDWYGAK